MPDHHSHQLELCALYSSTCLATLGRRHCMPIQLDLCQHRSACGTIKCAGQLSPLSADQPLVTAFDPIPSCWGSAWHVVAFASTAACLRAQACSILLVSGCARRMPNHLMTQLKLCTFYSSVCSATFSRRRCMPIQLGPCQHSSACGTIKRAGQLSPPSADQPRFTASDSILSCWGRA